MKKRIIMLGSAVMLAVLLVVGGTMAWFTATAPEVTNTFEAGTVEITLVDEFEGAPNVNPGDCYAKDVYVENTGTKTAFVRIKKDIVLIPQADRVLEEELNLGVVKYELGDNWVEHTDGYFYYNQILAGATTGTAVDRTTSLFKNIGTVEDPKNICFDGPTMNNDYQGATLNIIINAEAIQTTNEAPTTAGWNIDPLATP